MTPDTREALRALRMQIFETLTMFNGVLFEIEADGDLSLKDKAYILGQSEADRPFRADAPTTAQTEQKAVHTPLHTPEIEGLSSGVFPEASDTVSGDHDE